MRKCELLTEPGLKTQLSQGESLEIVQNEATKQKRRAGLQVQQVLLSIFFQCVAKKRGKQKGKKRTQKKDERQTFAAEPTKAIKLRRWKEESLKIT